jgi:hypothetical protein
VRERNLEGHLAPVEGAPNEAAPSPLEPPKTTGGNPGPQTTDSVDHGVVRDVPANPSKGPDAALKVAYELVLAGSVTPRKP